MIPTQYRKQISGHSRRNIEPRCRQFKPLKLKARTDCAPHQCPIARALRRLPPAFRNDHLRRFSSRQIRSQRVLFHPPVLVLGHSQNQWCTRIKVPNFNSIHAMPVAAFARFQQKVDTSPRSPRPIVRNPCLTIPATLRMRLKTQPRNDIFSVHDIDFRRVRTHKKARCDPKESHSFKVLVISTS